MIGKILIASGILLGISLGLRIILQYERAVRLRFGKFIDVLEPGLKWVIPIVDRLEYLDIRQQALDLKPQEVLSEDNVNLKIDGVVFYAVDKPKEAFLNVKDLQWQLAAKATSELKEIIGSMTMQAALTKRETIAKELLNKLNEAIKDEKTGVENKNWGVIIKAVQINNIELPESLVRAMAKTAEAEREKKARITKSEGEKESAKNFMEASKTYTENPVAIKLRELQTYQEIGTENNSLIIVVPTGSTLDPAGLTALGKLMIEQHKKPKKKEN